MRRRLALMLLLFALGACREPPAPPAPQPSWPRIGPVKLPKLGQVLALDHDGVHLAVGMPKGRTPGQLVQIGRAAGEKTSLLHGLGFGFERAGLQLPMRILRVEAARHGDRAAIRVRGELSFGSLWVTFTRTLTAGDVTGSVSITTELWQRQPGVSLVERAAWGKSRPWVPGVEEPVAELNTDAPWLGGFRPGQSFVLGFAHGPGTLRTVLDDNEPVLREMRLAAQAPDPRAAKTRWKTLVVLQPGPLGEALRRFGWARGRPFPEAKVALPVRPADSAVHVTLLDARPYLRTEPTAGTTMQVPLPENVPWVRLFATASGHAPSPTVTVEPGRAGQLTELLLPSSGELHVRVVDRKGRRPVPFRMRLWGIEGTPSPALGPEGNAAGALDTALTADGQLALKVPPGTYRLFVGHGPLWSLIDRRVRIVAGKQVKLALTLEREVEAPGWVGCDLHVHAAPSPDSEVSLQDRLRSLAAEDVAFAVPTDHNHVTDYGPLIAEGKLPLLSVPGVEVTTFDPAFGHFNAFPMRVDEAAAAGGAPVAYGLTPAALFASLRALDPALAIQVNHPRLEGGIGYFDATGYQPITGLSGDAPNPYADDYDLIEVWNGYDIARPDAVQRNLNEWLAMLQLRARVATGNSDSHTVRASYVGYPRTFVYVGAGDTIDPAAVVPALKAGRAFVSNGPVLLVELDGKRPGDHVPVDGASLALKVEVHTASWMSIERIDVYQGTRIVHSFAMAPAVPGKPRRVARTLQLEPTAGPVVVVARGSRPMDGFFGKQNVLPLAFTNPIWLE